MKRTPTAKKRKRTRPAPSTRRREAAAAPLLTRTELRRAIVELARTLAPADVGDLLAEEAGLRARAAALDGAPGVLLRAQLDLTFACLRDHLGGACPQIPFFTISLLTAGVAYMTSKLDLIPDFLPRLGTLDDAMVMALVCNLGQDGLRRYCLWKGLDPVPALGAERPRRPRGGATGKA